MFPFRLGYSILFIKPMVYFSKSLRIQFCGFVITVKGAAGGDFLEHLKYTEKTAIQTGIVKPN